MLPQGITHNEAAHSYELTEAGHTAICAYRLDGNRINFHHTKVPPALEGKGIGARLAKAALADARAKGYQIEADCWFVAKVMAKGGDR